MGLKFGPHVLGMDLTLFGVAMLELCGLGYGYLTLYDLYQVYSKKTPFDPNLRMCQLTHFSRAKSLSSFVFTHLYHLFYDFVDQSNIKSVKMSMLPFFDDLSLVFALLSDAGAKKEEA